MPSLSVLIAGLMAALVLTACATQQPIPVSLTSGPEPFKFSCPADGHVAVQVFDGTSGQARAPRVVVWRGQANDDPLVCNFSSRGYIAPLAFGMEGVPNVSGLSDMEAAWKAAIDGDPAEKCYVIEHRPRSTVFEYTDCVQQLGKASIDVFGTATPVTVVRLTEKLTRVPQQYQKEYLYYFDQSGQPIRYAVHVIYGDPEDGATYLSRRRAHELGLK